MGRFQIFTHLSTNQITDLGAGGGEDVLGG